MVSFPKLFLFNASKYSKYENKSSSGLGKVTTVPTELKSKV